MTKVLDQIRELEQQKQRLLQNAKEEALQKANHYISELAELGFHYQLTEVAAPQKRNGVRETVLQTVKSSDGITPAQIAERLGMNDKAGKQSVANALAALKRQKAVVSDNGVYRLT